MEFNVPINHLDDMCTNIEIKEDNIFEPAEVFAVALVSSNIMLCDDFTNEDVSITDTTRKAYSDL